MVSNLIVAVCAIIPLFFLMLIGVAVKKMKLLTELELAHVNRMVFKIFFFFMMFYNIYTTDIAETFRPHLMLFGVLGASRRRSLAASSSACSRSRTSGAGR